MGWAGPAPERVFVRRETRVILHRARLAIAGTAACLWLTAVGGATVIDFEGFDNGLEIGGGMHGGAFQPYPGFFTLTANSLGSPVQGASIFDSDPFGPNAGGSDPDLLVDLGNILILQNDAFSTQTVPGIYDTPNDEEDGGKIRFDFLFPVELLSLDLIDINGNGPVDVILQDRAGAMRTYNVAEHWTFDIFVQGRGGYDTLDLTSLDPQTGEGGGLATVSQDALFDPLDVVMLSVIHSGSAGIDNLVFIPAPSALILLAGGLLAPRRRRR